MPGPGRYRILRKIADGGMAEIFLATQRGAEGFERPVVLKRILAALVADPQFRNMMIDEAHVAMSLNHSNVAQVLDLGHARGRYFLVLEFVDGWDLNLLLQRVNAASFPLPAELALYIAAEVCRALSYAHAKTRDGKPLGIVHRDISPHNVLISEQGEVKLTDFGIAKALGRRESTGAGIIKGKLAFMSPEQASGAALDARSDLFSVGTMLYLMTAGRRPFEAPTDLEAILRVRQCDFPPPSTIKPDISPKLAAVIMRAMKLAPSERYQSAEEMLVDIESVQRTVFQPAGQTELKRWLASLQERDHVPSIGRIAALPPNDGTDSLDLMEGDDLVFDDESGVDRTIASGPPVDFAGVSLPPPLPISPPARPSSAATVGRPPPPPETASGSRHRVSALLVLAVGALAAVFYLNSKRQDETVPPPPLPAPELAQPHPTSPTVQPAPTVVAKPPAPPPATHDAQSALVAAPKPDATAVAAAKSASDAAATAENEKDDGEDEEALLQKKEPDAEDKVIGDDTPAPAAPARTGATRARPDYPVISVYVSSRPEGAVIRLKNRVFGRAPMNLRFRPGMPFELSFVKSGYATTTKRVTFANRKNQSVVVTLQKREKKKSLFRRIFGG